ncbi:peptidoglycan DD-metalloendopeptidase family protein [Streptomyces sp. NPDC007905]|uniref:M23 family metallopeptidase n=1 Tax=Streptomyces sp. NPDC007905 TaxID=3364788 RepID=UPI0036E49036
MRNLRPEPQLPGHLLEARALSQFLTAAPDEWPRIAPGVTEEVGADTLERIVRATTARIGELTTVTDTPDGLIVSGNKGQVRAWAQVSPQGELTALRIEGARYKAPRRRRRLPASLTWTAYLTLVTLWNVLTVWTANDRTAWLGDMATLAAFYAVVEGCGTPAQQPRPLRRTVEAGAVVALASAWRLRDLPTGHGVLRLAGGIALLVGTVWLVAAARLHRWKAPLSQPLLFPLEGTWYVIQGGGRILNHHAQLPEQRGALDLVALGPYGTRTRPGHDLPAHGAYGRPVRSPCDGRVISAANAVEDQKPGEIRYQPPYGNHVFIDTGREIVKLAHLRPGSVTVAKGDLVHAGQLLGEVGNTGNTTEPHLHIHAERDGVGLDLEFTGVHGRLHRGRKIRT